MTLKPKKIAANKYQLNNFDEQSFLQNYWQRKSLLIKSAFENFKLDFDENDLAGLALEKIVESRLIRENKKGDFSIEHGPFSESELQNLPSASWTLLVQAVDYYIEEVAELKKYFRFIADWRLDDLMVSFAPHGGSVGAHFDYYDVFLIQAKGVRRWRLGQMCDEQTPLVDNAQLKLIKDFQATQEHVLNAGDILYVPPGLAHWGVSESDDCMTISVGFRAPAYSEITSQLCDDLIDSFDQAQRYQDDTSSTQIFNSHPAQIENKNIEQFKTLISQQLLNKQFLLQTFGKLMTQSKYPRDESALEFEQAVELYDCWFKRADARLAFYVPTDDSDIDSLSENQAKRKTGKVLPDSLLVFANGEVFSCEIKHQPFIQGLCDNIEFNTMSLSADEMVIVEQLYQLNVFEFDEGFDDEDYDDDSDENYKD